MKANKVTLTVTIEVLSIDAAPAQLYEVASRIRDEFVSGQLVAADGDTATWKTETEPVEF